MNGDMGGISGMLGYREANVSESYVSSLSGRETSFKFGALDDGLDLSVSVKSVFLESERLGQRVFAQSIEVNLSVSSHGVAGFDVPTPVQVASNVLGFVEARLQQEVDQGANEEKIEGLVEQARVGVEKGFSKAKDDVELLGLMNDELSEDIGKSLALIDDGLGGVEKRLLDIQRAERSPVDSIIEEDALLTAGVVKDGGKEIGKVVGKESGNEGVRDSAKGGLGLSAFDFFQNRDVPNNESHEMPTVGSGRSFEGESSAFSLTTRDGDTIQIRFAQSEAAQYKANGRGQQYQVAYSGMFEIDVRGELDDEELAAINDLLVQVGEVSNLFFEDRFQEAFESALSIGFDASEIADFSLDLAKAQYIEVREYGLARSDHHSVAVERYQPLVEVANRFDDMFGLLSGFERDFEEVRSLLIENVQADFGLKQGSVQQQDSRNELLEGFSEFVDGVFKALQG